MPSVRIVDGLAAGHRSDAADLVFEYMAATQAEAGRPVPVSISQLPPVLRRECEDLAACYARPGGLFIAYREGQPTGYVGLTPGPFTWLGHPPTNGCDNLPGRAIWSESPTVRPAQRAVC